jgi:endo-1,4-beta-xylanase
MKRLIALVGALLCSLSLFADPIQTDVPALKDVFAGDFRIGCLLSYRHIGFPTDPRVPGQSPVIAPDGGSLIKYHMNSMSPGNNMKPAYTLDFAQSAAAYDGAKDAVARDYANTHPVVRLNPDIVAQLNWAKRQGFVFRGHTLVWHSSAPIEFFREGYRADGERVSRDVMAQRLDSYITSMFALIHEKWPGMLVAMDVVNEVIDDGTGRVRTSGNEWYATFGDDSYVRLAFESAARNRAALGETQMKLYYNDYNTQIPRKADGIVALCAPLHSAGLLDGIGLQDHDRVGQITVAGWIASYDKYAAACDEISVTEFDVAAGSANPDAAASARHANLYAALFKAFMDRSAFSGRGKIVSVSKDGLNDAMTFVMNQSTSLWDAKNQCKPAFYAVVGMAQSYNALTVLIAQASALTQGTKDAAAWKAFTASLSDAKDALARNYSADASAADALKSALDGLRQSMAAPGMSK